MKTIKYLITLTLVTFLSLGCNKAINKGKEYTVEGRLMYNCETPIVNTEFSFRQGDPGILGLKKPLSLTVKTNAEGYFKIVYNGKEANVSDFKIRDGGTIMNNIPVFENIDLGNIYYNPTFSFKISLDVVNPYTSNDTLEIPNYNDIFNENNNRIYISGPFENGVIDTVLNYPDMSSIWYNSASTFYVKYRINNNSNWVETELEISNHCKGELYDAVIKID
ncbi:hypothetical protein CW751_07100 [Brumimicrobium salinarum]|uniref:Lipoprotein n=1 Tax=Brumimicrobium salinarum TaxID=2058658 RepID=A0A2I0R2W9_9FLAO|nr:hypothetical protein [Brumimicrobium salinarum]PKR80928.1 hypothetical protein CW751_07100 [Brumimicrobium salinarum]